MKEQTSAILSPLSNSYGINTQDLVKFAGGNPESDGILYRFPYKKSHRILKVLEMEPGNPYALRCAEERILLMDFYAKNGVNVPCIIPNKTNELYTVAYSEEHTFFAYVMEEVKGISFNMISAADRDPFYEKWGAMIGQTHSAAVHYPIWEGIMVNDCDQTLLLWRNEMDFFSKWLKDAEVRNKWIGLREMLEELPANRNTMGFIHNDPHPYNFLIDGNRMTVLDFDVANCHFFCCDIATALFSILMNETNNFNKPLVNGTIERFLSIFLKGYERFHELPKGWMNQLELFLRYRRILLLTAFSNGLESRIPQFEPWRERILNDVPILPSSIS